MTGIKLFLKHELYGKGDPHHPEGWDKFVYDDENIHCSLLHLLVQSSPRFAQALLALSDPPTRISVTHQPNRGLFDLLFTCDEAQHYCEVKVWASLSAEQFSRQTAYLKSKEIVGNVYVLLTKAADEWCPARVTEESEGLSRAIGRADLVAMLGACDNDLSGASREVADAYRQALIHLKSRW